MKLNDDHMYHGAALTQIAEHPQFMSITAVRRRGDLSRSAFRINETIGVYLKYATDPKPLNTDYVFTFTGPDKDELRSLDQLCDDAYIAMVCVQDRHICCISYAELTAWLKKREEALGQDEDTSTFLVHLPPGQHFRCNMNMPGGAAFTWTSHNWFHEIVFPTCCSSEGTYSYTAGQIRFKQPPDTADFWWPGEICLRRREGTRQDFKGLTL